MENDKNVFYAPFYPTAKPYTDLFRKEYLL